MEVFNRMVARGNDVAIRWVPAHQGMPGNDKADEYAKAAAEGGNLVRSQMSTGGRPAYRMTVVATEARPRTTAQWNPEHVWPPSKSTAPPVEGSSAAAALPHEEGGGRPLLLAPVRARGNRTVPQRQGRQNQ